MSDPPETKMMRRTCKHCGEKFSVPKGESKRRGCPRCERALMGAMQLREETKPK